jgi:hypothetical protein
VVSDKSDLKDIISEYVVAGGSVYVPPLNESIILSLTAPQYTVVRVANVTLEKNQSLPLALPIKLSFAVPVSVNVNPRSGGKTGPKSGVALACKFENLCEMELGKIVADFSVPAHCAKLTVVMKIMTTKVKKTLCVDLAKLFISASSNELAMLVCPNSHKK